MMIDMEKEKIALENRLAKSEIWIANRLTDDMLDDDGYPTDTALDIIREWTFQMNQKELFEFIKSIWWMPDWGWKECEVIDEVTNEKSYAYYISTGGWSGNESIIQAMQENKWMFWTLTWQQSRRGGHYIFQLRKEDEE